MRSWGAHRSTSAAMEEQPNARRSTRSTPRTADGIPPAQRPGKIRPAPSTGSLPHAMGDEKLDQLPARMEEEQLGLLPTRMEEELGVLVAAWCGGARRGDDSTRRRR